MSGDTSIDTEQLKAHIASLFDALDAKWTKRFDQFQASLDAVAIEVQLTHGIAVTTEVIVMKLQSNELLKAKVVAASHDDETPVDEEVADTIPPNGNGSSHEP